MSSYCRICGYEHDPRDPHILPEDVEVSDDIQSKIEELEAENERLMEKVERDRTYHREYMRRRRAGKGV